MHTYMTYILDDVPSANVVIEVDCIMRYEKTNRECRFEFGFERYYDEQKFSLRFFGPSPYIVFRDERSKVNKAKKIVR